MVLLRLTIMALLLAGGLAGCLQEGQGVDKRLDNHADVRAIVASNTHVLFHENLYVEPDCAELPLNDSKRFDCARFLTQVLFDSETGKTVRRPTSFDSSGGRSTQFHRTQHQYMLFHGDEIITRNAIWDVTTNKWIDAPWAADFSPAVRSQDLVVGLGANRTQIVVYDLGGASQTAMPWPEPSIERCRGQPREVVAANRGHAVIVDCIDQDAVHGEDWEIRLVDLHAKTVKPLEGVYWKNFAGRTYYPFALGPEHLVTFLQDDAGPRLTIHSLDGHAMIADKRIPFPVLPYPPQVTAGEWGWTMVLNGHGEVDGKVALFTGLVWGDWNGTIVGQQTEQYDSRGGESPFASAYAMDQGIVYLRDGMVEYFGVG